MVKKYTDNYRLDIAYATILRNLKPIEEIPIHTALDITSGDNLTKKDMVPGDHIVYGGGGETGSTHSEFNIDYKTIGIGRVGARCGCVFEIIPNSWVTDNALIIQSYDKRFSLSFLRHFLSYSDLGQYANNAMQPVISKTRINDVTIPLIDIEEQNTFSKILDSIEKNEKFDSSDYELLKSKIEIIDNWETLSVEIEIQKDLTAQLKQSILQEAIQGKLTADWREQNPNTEPASELLKRIKAEKNQLIKDKKIKKEKALPPITAEEIPFELPEGWVWCRLGDISTYLNGKGFNSTDFKKNIGVKCIKITNAGVGEIIETDDTLPIEFENEYSAYLVYENDIVIALTRPYIADGLKVSLCPESYNKSLLNQRVAVVRACSNVQNKYIYKYLKTKFVLDGYKREFDSTGQQPNLKTEHVTNLIFPLAPVEEQKAIVEKVEILMQKCQALEQEIKTSEANAQMLMQAVLKEAFEGKQEVVEV